MRPKDILSIDDRAKYAQKLNKILNRTLTIVFLILFNLDVFYTSHSNLKIFIDNKFLFDILYTLDVAICLFIICIWFQNNLTKGSFTYDECFKIANKYYIENTSKKTTTSD